MKKLQRTYYAMLSYKDGKKAVEKALREHDERALAEALKYWNLGTMLRTGCTRFVQNN